LAFFIHMFIAPKLKIALASHKLSAIVIVFIFYGGVFGLFNILGEITIGLSATLLLNYLIDMTLLLLFV